MARQKTLQELLVDLRVEAELSLNAAQSVQLRDHHIGLLRNQQEKLWDEYDWPHMRVERVFSIERGQRYFDPPADLDIERIEVVQQKTNGVWQALTPGIGAEQYAAHDSDLDQRAWPIRRWRLVETGKIEVWPVPDEDPIVDTQEGYLKLIGIRKLARLVEDSDRCDLDGRMIVLYAAAQVLAAIKAPIAATKAQLAEQRKATVQNRASPRMSVPLFQTPERPLRRRFAPHYDPPT